MIVKKKKLYQRVHSKNVATCYWYGLVEYCCTLVIYMIRIDFFARSAKLLVALIIKRSRCDVIDLSFLKISNNFLFIFQTHNGDKSHTPYLYKTGNWQNQEQRQSSHYRSGSILSSRQAKVPVENLKMEKLSYSNFRDSLASIWSFEPKIIEQKLLSWSSSVASKLSYNNLKDCLLASIRSLEPKNVERKLLSWSSSVSSYIKDNPVIFSVQKGNNVGGEVQTYVNLPYLGAVSLDVFLFSSSAILSRSYMFWRSRRQAAALLELRKSQILKDGGKTNDENDDIETKRTSKPQYHKGPSSPPVKATIVKGYKDKELYKTIKECQDVRKSLRKVADPEVARKEKKKQLALQNVSIKIKGRDSNDGYLGMCPGSLQDARKFLKQVEPDQTAMKRATE